jgi:hypothetical protein
MAASRALERWSRMDVTPAGCHKRIGVSEEKMDGNNYVALGRREGGEEVSKGGECGQGI